MNRFGARLGVALAYGFALWFLVLFLPGNLSLDSFEQYEQAVAGQFNNHHPPVMAVCLHLLMKVGLGLKTLIAAQVLSGVAGLHCLVNACSRLLPRRDAAYSGPAAAAALVLLVSPLTPLVFYLTTFWKDSWFCIALVWTIVSLLWLLIPELSKLPRWVSTGVFLASVALAVLARHNGLVLLPVLVSILLLAPWPAGRRRGALLTAGTLAVTLGLSPILHAAFDVERRYVHENYVMSYDLLQLCEVDGQGEGCAERMLAEAGSKEFESFYRRDPALWAEWTRVVLAHPLALSLVKLELFAGTLNLSKGPHDYFLAKVDWRFGRYGLARDPARREMRQALAAFTSRIGRLPGLRWVLGSHAPWFTISALGTFWLVWRSWRERHLDPRVGLFALPFAYYMSYLPIFTTGDFRYMYPATLVVQVLTISWAAAALARTSRGRGRPVR